MFKVSEWLKMPTEALCQLADRTRFENQELQFDFCSIVSAKTGICTENCKFCAQSSATNSKTGKWLSKKAILKEAQKMDAYGIKRFSLVAIGKRVSKNELQDAIETIKCVKEMYPNLKICVSFGLLDTEDFLRLKDAGVERVHNNIETSERFFKEVCSTHTYLDKVNSIKAAQEVGLEVCSGLLLGMGECVEDRIAALYALKEMGIKSIPINFLMPIAGTALDSQPLLSDEEMLRTVALARLINPEAYIRLAGGRKLFSDYGERSFQAGANATITGDLLTTAGISTQMDIEMVRRLGFDF